MTATRKYTCKSSVVIRVVFFSDGQGRPEAGPGLSVSQCCPSSSLVTRRSCPLCPEPLQDRSHPLPSKMWSVPLPGLPARTSCFSPFSQGMLLTTQSDQVFPLTPPQCPQSPGQPPRPDIHDLPPTNSLVSFPTMIAHSAL